MTIEESIQRSETWELDRGLSTALQSQPHVDLQIDVM
ncbi:predicted protein [Sclerotinia sclerotiorum 1980 UF-70]|uniref:Uncharacterized protein n=1 Tax=Sclerotinia sclerotiorum (strain ATCC 18683 / 1980 / Ss-1) TaxID=665079 RepID=A7E635_SCLS1|nr:predicted protein [Sclerotinia sclerotiorum 1980 UF-70]EDN91357.1 predicted protein [Sclerotinia sclerotiorum 1980 UF-70]